MVPVVHQKMFFLLILCRYRLLSRGSFRAPYSFELRAINLHLIQNSHDQIVLWVGSIYKTIGARSKMFARSSIGLTVHNLSVSCPKVWFKWNEKLLSVGSNDYGVGVKVHQRLERL